MRGRSKRIYNKVCKNCHSDFVAKRKDKQFCSKGCVKKYYAKNGNNLVELLCPECDGRFILENWDKNKRLQKSNAVYCSKGCATKVSNRNRYKKRKLICKFCDKELLLNESDRKQVYCSTDCYNKDKPNVLAEQARRVGCENADKISKIHKERYLKNPECHPMLGKTHSKKTRKTISKKRKEYYETHDGYWKGKKIPESAKQKMSETRTRKWVNGEYNHLKSKWNKGNYFFEKANKRVCYRSSWELGFMRHLDKKENIFQCEYESIRIPYYDTENKKRYYIPDFLVEYKDGRTVLYEVKPFVRKSSEINKRKFKAAREYCKKNNIKFKVITEKYLKHIGAI